MAIHSRAPLRHGTLPPGQTHLLETSRSVSARLRGRRWSEPIVGPGQICSSPGCSRSQIARPHVAETKETIRGDWKVETVVLDVFFFCAGEETGIFLDLMWGPTFVKLAIHSTASRLMLHHLMGEYGYDISPAHPRINLPQKGLSNL